MTPYDMIGYLRSQITMKSNWFRMKVQFMAVMKKAELMQLEYTTEKQEDRVDQTLNNNEESKSTCPLVV